MGNWATTQLGGSYVDRFATPGLTSKPAMGFERTASRILESYCFATFELLGLPLPKDSLFVSLWIVPVSQVLAVLTVPDLSRANVWWSEM